MNRQVILPSDAGFPMGCCEANPACERLYVVGELSNLQSPMLAIVGARKATPYGLNCATRFARQAAALGVTIVSGGAIGCDQAAHKGALEAGGKTVVVLGCGADVVYPQSATSLFARILETGGTIISEAPWGSAPSRWAFKKRNRIIAALGHATLIVEAGLPSGTFSTADATLSQGKDVLAIPGSIFAKESKGANRLILQGAMPIVDDESFSDALRQVFAGSLALCGRQLDIFSDTNIEASGVCKNVESCTDLGSAQSDALHKPLVSIMGQAGQDVLELLVQEPKNAESLLGICGKDVVSVIRYLSAMEFAGEVVRLRDGRYSAAALKA